MMPSRGWHLARGKLTPLRGQVHCRSLSTSPRPNLAVASNISRSALRTSSSPWTRTTPTAILSIAAIRHASTSPSPAQGAPPGASPTNEMTTFSNLDTINLDNLESIKPGVIDPSSIPEHIGYLKEVGLDYGYGFTSTIQWVLEHIHITGEIPWWGSIALTALAMRLIMFPLFLKASDNQARQKALSSVTKPFYDQMTQFQKEGNNTAALACYRQVAAVHKRAGIKTRYTLAPIAVQGVLGYCGFKLMRAMADLPVPGLKDGGFLWVTDLTVSDGYLILPLLMATTIHMTVRLGGETGAGPAPMSSGMQKTMLYGMPVMIFVFTAWMPSAVTVWFCGSGIIGISQNLILRNAKVRSMLGLAPLYTPPASEAHGGVLSAITGRSMDSAKERVSKAATTASGPSAGSPRSGAGENGAYMRPSYQAPNIRTRDSGSTIDTTLVTATAPGRDTTPSQSDMVQPEKKSMFEGITSKAREFSAQVRESAKLTEAQKAERAKKDFKKRAKDYEERAKKRDRTR